MWELCFLYRLYARDGHGYFFAHTVFLLSLLLDLSRIGRTAVLMTYDGHSNIVYRTALPCPRLNRK